MDVLQPVVKYLTAPLFTMRDGFRYSRHRRALEESQWLAPEAQQEAQVRKLGELLDFAFRKNAFYRRRMEVASLVPTDIRGPAELEHLPILTKDDIRNAGFALFSEGYTADNTHYTRTGGSTGVPLQVYVDTEAMNWKFAATWRHNAWANWHPGDRVAAVWGDTDKKLQWTDWVRFHFQHRSIFLDTLKFSDDRLRDFHARVRSYKPKILMGHAHSVYQLAAFCQEHDLKMPAFAGIITTAMTLSEHERRCIEETFDSRVFNRYGCEELSIVASESEAHNGLHVFSEGLILEYIETGAPGEHEIVVTDLYNRAMPMIRYAIGDVVQKAEGACSSGRGLERLQHVSGRTADFLYRPDGTPVFGISLLDTYIIHIPGIHQAQMVQNELQKIDILVVPTSDFGPQTVRAVEGVIAKEFGQDVRATVRAVERLEQTERGKYRFAICNLPNLPNRKQEPKFR